MARGSHSSQPLAPTRAAARSAGQEQLRFARWPLDAETTLDAEELLQTQIEGLEGAFGWLDEDDEGIEATVAFLGQAPQEAEVLEEGPPLELGALGTLRTSKEIEVDLSQELVREGHGSDDYERDDGLPLRISARSRGEEVARLDFNLGPEGLRIRWVEVDDAHRRLGIGTVLLDKLEELYPEGWDTNGYTDEGSALMDSRL